MWSLLAPALASLIDKLIPDPQTAAAAKIKMYELQQQGELRSIDGAISIIVAESTGNWLQRSWRPVMMLTFTALIVARWFGWSAPGLTPEEYESLWTIVQIGIGGYVIGRSGEKIAASLGKGN